MTIKTVTTLMLPVGLGLALYAEPVIELLYGSDYSGAATLRLLGALSVLWGVNATVVTVLVSRDRPGVYTAPALVALVPNLALSLILIPPYGAKGAAIAAVAAAAVLSALALPRAARLFGLLRGHAGRPDRGGVGDGPVRRRPHRRPVDPRRAGVRGHLRHSVPHHREDLLPADFAFYSAAARLSRG